VGLTPGQFRRLRQSAEDEVPEARPP
jgi:hypothetical protein